MKKQKDARWRILKHNEALALFKQDIVQKEYVNPEKRVQMYKEL